MNTIKFPVTNIREKQNTQQEQHETMVGNNTDYMYTACMGKIKFFKVKGQPFGSSTRQIKDLYTKCTWNS